MDALIAMLTPERYQVYVDAVDKFGKYIREHPEVIEEAARKYEEQFVDVRDVSLGDKVPFVGYVQDSPVVVGNALHELAGKFTRDCHKCVYEVGCHGNPVDCNDYKRDASDGGYY